MALSQQLLIDTISPMASGFTLAYVNAVITSAPTVGTIETLGATPYLTWIQQLGANPTDIGGGTQTNQSMAGWLFDSAAVGSNTAFPHYFGSTLKGTGKAQQPIRWDESVNNPNQVVWGVYFPQIADTPDSTWGKIEAYSTTVEAPISVSSNNPDDNDAKQGLSDLLAQFGSKYASPVFKGPTFTSNANQNIFGAQGIVAMGCFVTYSNINGTWLAYAK